MFLNPTMSAALDRIAERADDVRRAFTPGARPEHNDVATSVASSEFTLDALSVGVSDGEYFVTRDARGQTAYTQNGSFALASGMLTNGEGCAVLGVRGAGSALRELRVDPVDLALGRAAAPRIEPDGTFAYTRQIVNPRTGDREMQRVIVGRIAVARFPAGTKLESSDGIQLRAPNGTSAQTGVPNDGTFAPVTPMRRQRSRVDLDESLARLKDAYVAFDALAALETAKGHLGKTAVDLVK